MVFDFFPDIFPSPSWDWCCTEWALVHNSSRRLPTHYELPCKFFTDSITTCIRPTRIFTLSVLLNMNTPNVS